MKLKKIFITIAVLAIAAVSIAPGAAAQRESTVRGDANGDKIVNIFDVTTIQRHVAEMNTLSGKQYTLAADVNGDKKITIDDATALQYFLAEYENVNNVEGLIYFDPYELPFIPNI